MQRTLLCGAVIWVAGVQALLSAPVPRFDVVIFRPIELPTSLLPAVDGVDLSDSGYVAGVAQNGFESVTFLRTPDGRMVVFDPGDERSSGGSWVNDQGDVYGIWYDKTHYRPEPFLHSEAEGTIWLRDSLPDPQAELFVFAMNNHGELIGDSGDTPLVFARETGWRDAHDLHPDLPRPPSRLTIGGLNDCGDFLFRTSLGAEPGSRFQRLETFIVTRTGRLLRFGAEGSLILGVSSLNRWGRVVGTTVDKEGPLESYAWTPRRGAIRVDVPGTVETIAQWSPIKNVVAGTASFPGQPENPFAWRVDGLFVHSVGSRGPRFVVEPRAFRRLARKSGFDEFLGIDAVTFNERLEFVGEIFVQPRHSVPFLYRHGAGLFSLQSIVDAAGVKFTVTSATDLNREGQILVFGKARGARRTSALLTPVD